MNIEETRRNRAAGCRVDLRQMFNKRLCRLKFGGRIRHTKENDVDSYALYRDDDADGLLIRDGELLEFDGWKTTESGTVYTVGTSESGKQIYLTEKEYGMLMPC